MTPLGLHTVPGKVGNPSHVYSSHGCLPLSCRGTPLHKWHIYTSIYPKRPEKITNKQRDKFSLFELAFAACLPLFLFRVLHSQY